jgi:hypothetical protein
MEHEAYLRAHHLVGVFGQAESAFVELSVSCSVGLSSNRRNA